VSEHNEHGSFVLVGAVKCVECPACGFTFDARHTDAVEPSEYECDCCGYTGDAETAP